MTFLQNGFEVSEIKTMKRDDGKYEFSVKIYVENYGNKWLNKEEGYWHIFFPDIEIRLDMFFAVQAHYFQALNTRSAETADHHAYPAHCSDSWTSNILQATPQCLP